MKKGTNLATKLLAAALLFTIILPANAKSLEFGDLPPIIVDGVVQPRSTSFDSQHKSLTVNGITYEMWTTLYQDSPTEFRGATWVSTADYQNVPANYMGTQCILYRPDGSAYYATKMLYNTTSFYFQWVSAPSVVADSSGIYCGGYVSLKDGNGAYVVDAPHTLTLFPSARGFTASDDVSEDMSRLATTLDQNGQYPVTASGKSYGSGMLAEVVGHEPDLILAEGINGMTGYIQASDLHPNVNTSEEAAIYMAELANSTEDYQPIPLYDLNENIIDTFLLYVPDLDAETPAGIQGTIDQIEGRKNWPRNSKGEAYGSYGQLLEAKSIGIDLDMISAVGTDGQMGYFRRSDDPGEVMHTQLGTADTQAVLEYMAYLRSLPEIYFIPLYDVEGNVIGKFRRGNDCFQTLSAEEIYTQISAD